MQIYILMIFIWVVAWMYVCGLSDRRITFSDAPLSSLMTYMVLLLFWPYLMGKSK